MQLIDLIEIYSVFLFSKFYHKALHCWKTLLHRLVGLWASHLVSKPRRVFWLWNMFWFGFFWSVFLLVCFSGDYSSVYLFLSPLQSLNIVFEVRIQNRAKNSGTCSISALHIFLPTHSWHFTGFVFSYIYISNNITLGSTVRRQITIIHIVTEKLWMEGISGDCLVQPFWLKQGQLHQVLQGHVQGVEYLQGRRLLSFSGKPVPVLSHTLVKKGFHVFKWNLRSHSLTSYMNYLFSDEWVSLWLS